MTLNEWLKLEGLTVKDGAKKIGVSSQTLYSWIAGRRVPRPAQFKSIREASNNRVDANTFFK